MAAQTQVHLPATGFVDLALSLATADQRHDVWIEVKVNAGETGTQLDSYARFVEALPEDSRPRLVVLSRHPLRDHRSFQWVPWQAVWGAITAKATASPYWHDFKTYLEEIHMAGDAESSVTSLESLSLAALPQLTAKTQSILWRFVALGAARWPAYRWPTSESELISDLHSQLRKRNRLMFYASSGSRAYPVVGVVSSGDEAMLTIWVESPPKRTDVRRQLLEQADEHGLPSKWVRQLGSWQALTLEQRLVTFSSHDDAAEWLLQGFIALDAVGLMALLPTLGQPTPDEADEPTSVEP